MELTPYVDALRHELAVAAEAGGADARDLAERLASPLESAARLALLNALSDAASEITRDLAPGSVDLRLRGREPSFVVTPPPTDHPIDEPDGPPEPLAPPTPPMAPEGPDGAEGAMARINFRPSEHLKARIEDAANRAGLSVNAWLVRAATAVLDGTLQPDTGERRTPRAARGSQHYTGWVR